MKIVDLLQTSTTHLKTAGIDSLQLDARLLFCHALGIDRAQLLSQSERVLTTPEIDAITALIARRANHESVARIIGHREFWGLNFSLNEATLEPRPDSEIVIEVILKTVKPRSKELLTILDLGTGTGCLLLALLHELPNATGVGIDISLRAVEQATQNAAVLKLDSRATFLTGNWLEDITDTFDIIISNPPYIPASDIPTLMPDVRDYDPLRALDGGDDGLTPYRILIPQLPHFLKPQGCVAFEFGQGQAPAVTDLFHTNGFANIKTHKDLSGIERCILAVLG